MSFVTLAHPLQNLVKYPHLMIAITLYTPVEGIPFPGRRLRMAGVDEAGGKHRRGEDDDIICDLIGHPPPWINPVGREDHVDTC